MRRSKVKRSRRKFREYERRKLQLMQMQLSPSAYEQALKQLARELKI